MLRLLTETNTDDLAADLRLTDISLDAWALRITRPRVTPEDAMEALKALHAHGLALRAAEAGASEVAERSELMPGHDCRP